MDTTDSKITFDEHGVCAGEHVRLGEAEDIFRRDAPDELGVPGVGGLQTEDAAHFKTLVLKVALLFPVANHIVRQVEEDKPVAVFGDMVSPKEIAS